MRILFITTHNLATNPRLVKEIRLALDNNYSAEVICFTFNNWSNKNDQKLKEEFKTVVIHSIPAGRSPFFRWLISTLSEKSFRFISRVLPVPVSLSAHAVSRRNILLINAIKKCSKPDLVIGHNPGALYATYRAKKYFNCAAGFDAEDYHAGEGSNAYLQILTKKIMGGLLPQMNYTSFAAPLIREEIIKDTPKQILNPIDVLNYFPAKEFNISANLKGEKVKLIWFSQNISSGRGLEVIIDSINNFSEDVELHLYGNVNKDFEGRFLSKAKNVFIHEPVSQEELHRILGKYDIGLALEVQDDKNRDLVITNKLLAYLQAGLYIIATNTSAQKNFLSDYSSGSVLFNFSSNSFQNTLCDIIKNIWHIRNLKLQRYNSFHGNWEIESGKLLKMWEKVLSLK